MSAVGVPPSTTRPPGTRPDSIAKNAVFSFATQLTTGVLTAALTIFLVRTLAPQDFGLFALAMSVGNVAIALTDFGLSKSIGRFVAEHRDEREQVGALVVDGLKLKILISGTSCLALGLLARPVADAYGQPDLALPLQGIAIATFGQTLVLMLLTVVTSLGRAAAQLRLVAIESVLEVSTSIGLVLLGTGAAGAAFGRAFGYVVGAVVGVVLVLRLVGRPRLRLLRAPDRARVRRVSGYAGGLFVVDAAYFVSGSVSPLILGAYLSPVASGTFQAVTRLILFLQYVGLSTANAVAPRLARGAGGEPNVAALVTSLRLLIGFQCLLLAPTIVWADPIVLLILGDQYREAADVLVALAPYIFISGFTALLSNSVNYYGEARRRIPFSLATLVLAVVLGVVLVPPYGLVGAAIATDVAYGLYTLAHLWLCWRLLHLPLGALAWSLACGLTAAGAMAIVLLAVGTSDLGFTDWVIGGVSGVLAYLLMLVFTRELRPAMVLEAATRLRRIVPAAAPHAPSEPPLPQPATVPPLQPERPAGVEAVAARAAGPDERLPEEDAVTARRPAATPPRGSATDTYEIAWRGAGEIGTFELRSVESPHAVPPDDGEPAVAVSEPVEWGWRIPPAPTPEVRRAHDDLAARLTAEGWRPVGSGGHWYAQRFRKP